jgi:hypothetical protein
MTSDHSSLASAQGKLFRWLLKLPAGKAIRLELVLPTGEKCYVLNVDLLRARQQRVILQRLIMLTPVLFATTPRFSLCRQGQIALLSIHLLPSARSFISCCQHRTSSAGKRLYAKT